MWVVVMHFDRCFPSIVFSTRLETGYRLARSSSKPGMVARALLQSSAGVVNSLRRLG